MFGTIFWESVFKYRGTGNGFFYSFLKSTQNPWFIWDKEKPEENSLNEECYLLNFTGKFEGSDKPKSPKTV